MPALRPFHPGLHTFLRPWRALQLCEIDSREHIIRKIKIHAPSPNCSHVCRHQYFTKLECLVISILKESFLNVGYRFGTYICCGTIMLITFVVRMYLWEAEFGLRVISVILVTLRFFWCFDGTKVLQNVHRFSLNFENCQIYRLSNIQYFWPSQWRFSFHIDYSWLVFLLWDIVWIFK